MTYTTYTGPGAFSDGGPPGISAAVLNGMETMLTVGWFDSLITSDTNGGIQPLSLKPTHNVSVNGTTSGTATLYQFMQGTVKAFLCYLSGYKNAGSTEQRLTLPVPFTSRCLFLVGNFTNGSVWNGGSQVASQIGNVNALSASGGTIGGYTNFHPNDFGEVTSAFDQIGLGVSQVSTFTGCLFGIGV